MALISFVGRSYSNSFVTVSEAESILDLLPYDQSEWDALSLAEKEYRLRLAAELIGMLPFRGRKAFEGQALCFPRDCQSDMMSIPDSVKTAQVDVAYSVVHKAIASLPDISHADAEGRLNRVSLGGILHFGLTDTPSKVGNVLNVVSRLAHVTVFLELKQFLTGYRGNCILNDDEIYWHTLSTTTTTSTSSSSTTSSTSSTS